LGRTGRSRHCLLAVQAGHTGQDGSVGASRGRQDRKHNDCRSVHRPLSWLLCLHHSFWTRPHMGRVRSKEARLARQTGGDSGRSVTKSWPRARQIRV